MTALVVVLLALLLLGAVAVVLSVTAGRLDRLHLRLDAAAVSLDRQLLDRAARVHDLAVCGLLDPATSVLLIGAVEEARATPGPLGTPARDDAESAVGEVLREVLDRDDGAGGGVQELWDAATAGQRDLLLDLAAACERLTYADRFRADLTTRTVRVRAQPLVRLLHLAGHAPWPTTVWLDTRPPEGLAGLPAHAPRDGVRGPTMVPADQHVREHPSTDL